MPREHRDDDRRSERHRDRDSESSRRREEREERHRRQRDDSRDRKSDKTRRKHKSRSRSRGKESRDSHSRHRRSPSRERHRRSSSRDRNHRSNKSRERSVNTNKVPERSVLPSIVIPQENRSKADKTSRPVNDRSPPKDAFSRESFENFARDNNINLNNIDSEEDRIAIHEKMQELLKRQFAAQGKIYPPPPKPEKPEIDPLTGFANDGSFMEQFKQYQLQQKLEHEKERKRREHEDRLKNMPLRRRGGKILKTGIVAKNKAIDESDQPNDAWSMYLKEVQKYKDASCDADANPRPLVK